MTLWKSPVFYFGLFLVAVVTAALLAPFVMDWGRYRSDLEAYGQKLTGRQVTVAGDIAVRLFPWPRLTAQDVRIANPTQATPMPFLVAEQVEVRLTLGALLNGTIQVESIAVAKPTLNLERRADGTNNWHFTPTASVRNSSLLEHVMLDKIHVTDGVIFLNDELRKSHSTFSNITAEFSAPHFMGPWRSSGTANFNATPLHFSVSTAALETGKPLPLSLRVNRADKVGYDFSFEGEAAATQISGTVSLTPTERQDGKGDLIQDFIPVRVKAKVAGDYTKLALTDIDVRAVGATEQASLLTGSATLGIGPRVQASLDLAAPRLDLDAILADGTASLLRHSGGLALINRLLASLPDADVKTALLISSLTFGGEQVEAVALQASANRDGVKIDKLSGRLPGSSEAQFTGTVHSGVTYAEASGTISVTSRDLRSLATWLAPQAKSRMTKIWTGNRGQFKASSAVSLSASRLEFKQLIYELDGQKGSANLSFLINGERPIMAIWLDAPVADLDLYAPQGFLVKAGDGDAQWSDILAPYMQAPLAQDMRLTLQSGELHLNGVLARDVTFDVETSAKGLEVKSIEIGSVGGAKLSASGVVLNTAQGLDGQVDVSLTADAPQDFLRLAGLLPHNGTPQWSRGLGQTNLALSLQALPTAGATALGYAIAGQSGPYHIDGKGSLLGAAEKGVALQGVMDIAADNSAAMASLFGIPDVKASGSASRLHLTTDGYSSEGLASDVQVQIYGTDIHYAGVLHPFNSLLGVNGRLTVQSETAQPLLAALQLPGAPTMPTTLNATAVIKSDAQAISLSDIKGTSGQQAFSGTVALSSAGVVKADLDVDRAAVADFLLPAFLPWSERIASFDQTLAKALPWGLTGEIWIKPQKLTIYNGLVIPEAQVGIVAQNATVQLTVYGKDATGEKIALDVQSHRYTDLQQMSGRISLPLDLAQDLKLATGEAPFTGTARLEATFNGEGRSTAAVLASLTGKGGFTLSNATIGKLDPDGFGQLVTGVQTDGQMQAAFAALHGGRGVVIGQTTSPLAIVDGVLNIQPFGSSTAQADVMVSPTVDIKEQILDIGLHVTLKALPDLPPMDIYYRGGAQALVKREDSSALSAFLGFKSLNQGVGQLEKLQAEQERLAQQEADMLKQDKEKLEAYTAQRAEMRLRQRELRIQAEQRQRDEVARKAALTKTPELPKFNAEDISKLLNDTEQAEVPAPLPPATAPVILVPPAAQP